MSDLVDELRDLHRDYVAGRWHQYDRVKDILAIAADALEAKDKEIDQLEKRLERSNEIHAAQSAAYESLNDTCNRLREALQRINNHANDDKRMSEWDSWRKYISDGGKASWPRDAFETLLDWFSEESSQALKEQDGE